MTNRRHLNGAAPTLEQQVAAALAVADDSIAAAKLEALIEQVESGIRAAEADAARQRDQAMDPSISPDLRDARSRLEDSIFLVGRLKTLRPRLERRLAEVLDAKQHARWLAEYEAVKLKRDEAVELFQHYPDIVLRLLTILHTARNVDAEIARVNLAAPSGESKRLLGVEKTARNITGTFSTAVPSILDSIAIPDLERPGRMLWPPPRLNPALLVPKPEPDSSRWGPDWGVRRDAAQQKAREQAERDREQFERDAEIAQSDGGRIPVWWKNGHDSVE